MKQPNDRPALARRQMLGAAGTAGALVAAATLLPGRPDSTTVEGVGDKPAPEKGSGYQASAHVLRYYQTARV